MIYIPVVTIYTTRFNFHKYYVLPTQCIFVFFMDLRTKSDYFLTQHQWRTQEFFFRGVGGQQIQLGSEGREKGDLGAVASWSGVPLNLQMSETRIHIRLLRMYWPRNWKFGTALPERRHFGGGGGGC
jgi:hypothetical protein